MYPPRLPFSACLYSTSQGQSTSFYSGSCGLNFSSSPPPRSLEHLEPLIHLPALRYWPKRQIITTARNRQGGNLQPIGNGIRLMTPTTWRYHPSSLGQGWRNWKAFDGGVAYKVVYFPNLSRHIYSLYCHQKVRPSCDLPRSSSCSSLHPSSSYSFLSSHPGCAGLFDSEVNVEPVVGY